MVEFFVIFSLAAVGSMVCLSAYPVLRFFSRKTQSESLVAGAGRSQAAEAAPQLDPVLTFGFIIACYGAIALALVIALPGSLAMERTGLTFAMLCVGGLIAEISSTGTTAQLPNLDVEHERPGSAGRPISLRLSLALTFVLNLTFAVLSSGQGLIEIIPPQTAASGHAPELDPIVVVARRTYDPLEHTVGPF